MRFLTIEKALQLHEHTHFLYDLGPGEEEYQFGSGTLPEEKDPRSDELKDAVIEYWESKRKLDVMIARLMWEQVKLEHGYVQRKSH